MTSSTDALKSSIVPPRGISLLQNANAHPPAVIFCRYELAEEASEVSYDSVFRCSVSVNDDEQSLLSLSNLMTRSRRSLLSKKDSLISRSFRNKKRQNLKMRTNSCRMYPHRKTLDALEKATDAYFREVSEHFQQQKEEKEDVKRINSEKSEAHLPGRRSIKSDRASRPPSASENRTTSAPNVGLEISPGVIVSLRGSVESWSAIQRGFCVHLDCFSCSSEIVCIADADYVLCPVCKVISPICSTTSQSPWHQGGVGLGLRAEECPVTRSD